MPCEHCLYKILSKCYFVCLAHYFEQYRSLSEKKVLEKFSTHLIGIDMDDDQMISLDEMKEWLTRDAIFEAGWVYDDETTYDYLDIDTNNDMKLDFEEMFEHHARRFERRFG